MDYEDQLSRALDETPEEQGTGERFDVPDPDLRGEGNVTVYENFRATVRRLDRDADHLMKFLQDELGTSARIDESGRARFTGEFREDRVEDALDEYVDAYVLCPDCGAPDTRLETEDGVERLACTACGARTRVGS